MSLTAVSQEDIYSKYDIYRNPFRVALNKISWTVTTGYGATFMNHDLDGYYYYQDAFNQFISPVTSEQLPEDNFSGYENWLNDPNFIEGVVLRDPFQVPYDRLQDPVNNPLLQSQQFFLSTDTAELGYKGVFSSIPILISAHYNYEKFRVGFGWSYQQQFTTRLKPTNFKEQVRAYEPDFKSTGYSRIFGILGYEFYEFWWHSFVAELQIGSMSYGNAFPLNDPGLFFSVGISIEQNLSEYFRVIVKPSYDIKNYVLPIPDGPSITHNHNTFFIQAGISINIPDIPRSPMKSDHVQLKHVIAAPNGTLMEVRGQPIWKRQNPKVGENHRKLWRYKLKNRRKMHPY